MVEKTGLIPDAYFSGTKLRWLLDHYGVQEEAAPEWRRIDVRRDDVFLVCSDGLYDAASEADIRDALAAGGAAKEIAARLARLAVAGGAGDNYSLVVVKIGGRR